MLRVLLNPCATCMRASETPRQLAFSCEHIGRATCLEPAGDRVLAVVSAQGEDIWLAACSDHTPAGRLQCACNLRSCNILRLTS